MIFQALFDHGHAKEAEDERLSISERSAIPDHIIVIAMALVNDN
jgi:hypothetical protein